jgi:hypothetical protein
VLARASYGQVTVFNPRAATDDHLRGGVVALEQTRSQLRLDSLGPVTIVDPTLPATPAAGPFGGPVVIEEDVRDGIVVALRFAADVLDDLDPTHRAGVIAPAATLVDFGPQRDGGAYAANASASGTRSPGG